MKPAEIILHVGAGKTGSSALQVFFKENRPFLIRKGADFPVEESQRVLEGNAVPIIKYLASSKPHTASELADSLGPIAAMAEAPRLLLSHEGIFKAPVEKLTLIKNALAGFSDRVTLVFGVREISEHSVSVYYQNVRNHGETRLLEEFLEQYEPPFVPAFKNLVEVFGRENLVPFIYSDRPEENLRRFLVAAEISTSAPDTAPRLINRSLSAFEIGVMRYLNGGLAAGPQYRLVRRTIADTMTGMPPIGGQYSNPLKLPEKIRDRYRQITEFINAEFLSREAEDRRLPPPKPVVEDRSTPYSEIGEEAKRMAELLFHQQCALLRVG